MPIKQCINGRRETTHQIIGLPNLSISIYHGAAIVTLSHDTAGSPVGASGVRLGQTFSCYTVRRNGQYSLIVKVSDERLHEACNGSLVIFSRKPRRLQERCRSVG